MCYSKCVQVTTGVPHGTVFGTFLFPLYSNGILNYFNYSNTMLPADDTMLYIIGVFRTYYIIILFPKLENISYQ